MQNVGEYIGYCWISFHSGYNVVTSLRDPSGVYESPFYCRIAYRSTYSYRFLVLRKRDFVYPCWARHELHSEIRYYFQLLSSLALLAAFEFHPYRVDQARRTLR